MHFVVDNARKDNRNSPSVFIELRQNVLSMNSELFSYIIRTVNEIVVICRQKTNADCDNAFASIETGKKEYAFVTKKWRNQTTYSKLTYC